MAQTESTKKKTTTTTTKKKTSGETAKKKTSTSTTKKKSSVATSKSSSPKPRKPKIDELSAEELTTEVVETISTTPSTPSIEENIEDIQSPLTEDIAQTLYTPSESTTVETPKVVTVKTKKKGKKNQEVYIAPRYLETDINIGLTAEQVSERVAHGIVNATTHEKGKTIFGIICSNVFTFFNLVFCIITIGLVLVGSYTNLLFLATVIPNLVIGIIQEIKAKKMIEKLSLMSAPMTTVIRDGVKKAIPINEVVLDEIVEFTNGNQVCADCIVISGAVEANEAMITGESDAIDKKEGSLLYSGSYITSGTCIARAEKIANESYIETLASSAKKYRRPNSELLRSLNIIFKIVSVIIVPLGILTFLNTYNSSEGALQIDIIKNAVEVTAGSMVGMIPAGLFLLTSMALFVGVIRLGKNNTLVQELYCIETLARVDMLCLDKTGTITDGTMKVWDCIEVQNHTDYTIREIVGSMLNAFQETNATSEALIAYFDKNDCLTATDVIPFSSKRKFSAVTFKNTGTFVLGAPEFVLKSKFETIRKRVERYTSQGCRVLVLGHTSTKVKSDEPLKNVSPVAIIVIQDHIREEAHDTIEYFNRNNVAIRVISGDNPLTVSYIARRVGIPDSEKFISLDGLTDDEVRDIALDYTIFGRVSPSQKKVLIETFRKNKKTVAMTGDGVNDILALKEADCSIAMASGSEAARYVSHLVLTDSNFSSMPKVVNEGRRVINNIQKTSTLFLVKTMFAICLTIMYLLIKEDYIFSPRNLSMIEWFAIGAPAFFIALQSNHSQVRGKFIANVIRSTLPGALTVLMFHLILYFIREPLISQYPIDGDYINQYKTIAILVTTTVSMLVLFDVCRPFNLIRSIAFGISMIGCVVMLSIPFFRDYLGLSNLSMPNLLLLLIFALLASPMMNLFSSFIKKFRLSK